MELASQKILLGDCLDVLANERNVPAIVADPPANIAFMGRSWDRAHPCDDYVLPCTPRSKAHERELRSEESFIRYWSQRYAMAYDIADQYATAIIWTLPRTSYQTATAMRRAGWDIRDNLVHLFGTGWAKTGNALAPGQEGWLLATKGKPDLDIDACRVPRGGAVPIPGGKIRASRHFDGSENGYEMVDPPPGNPLGSLPKNALLSHCEECVRVGNKGVKASAPPGKPTAGTIQDSGSSAYGDGKPRGTSQYGNGTESVPAWHCLAGCVCGARSKWDPEKPLPRCPCGETWRWICPVAEVNGQSGESVSPGKTGRGQDGGKGAYSKIGAQGTVQCPSDSGGASRFFNTFSQLSMANVPNDGTMSATQGGDSWNENANHAVCDSCRSAKSNDSADIAAQGAASQRNADRSDASKSTAKNAGNVSKNSQETAARIVRENVPVLQDEPSDQSASVAENHARECATNSVQSVAPISFDQESSRHGLDSTGMLSGRTPNQCRVCGAVLPENIVTTTTTQSLETSNGFAPSVTNTSITWVSQEEREYARTSLPSYKYLSKCSSSERHAGCEHLYWRANKKNPFGFDQVTREEFDALPPPPKATHRTEGTDLQPLLKGISAQGNVHPTVKSYRLMHWLHSLTGAKKIADLCAGSGTGMIAAALDNIEWIGAEVCPEAVLIAQARHAFWSGLSPEAIELMKKDSATKSIQKQNKIARLENK
jgi:hypothetical protein